jgi:LacI family transcriptional regulator
MTNKVTVRIKDIAKMAGVSQGTVDRVLHKRGNVSSDALAKVNAVLEKIHYRPNLIARSLGKGKSVRISVLLPYSNSDPYWEEAKMGILQAQENWDHYRVAIEPFFYEHDGESSLESMAMAAINLKSDGIVIAPIYLAQAMTAFNLFQENKIPYILFNTNIVKAKPLSFIGQDLFQSGRLAGQLMSLMNCTESFDAVEFVVLHIGEEFKDSVHLIEKERGFRDYFKKNRKDNPKVISVNIDSNKKSFKKEIEKFIENPRVKGLFVTTSNSLSIVASILSTHDRDDISLIGYDILEKNLKFLKSGVINFLINQNPKRQAQQGISHMVNHLLFHKKIPANELFPLEIIIQENVDSYLSSGIH